MALSEEEQSRRVLDRCERYQDMGAVVLEAIAKIPKMEGEVKDLHVKYDNLSRSLADHSTSVATKLDSISSTQNQILSSITPIINFKTKLLTYLSYIGAISVFLLFVYLGSTEGAGFLKSFVKTFI